jgi:hypothetical protein
MRSLSNKSIFLTTHISGSTTVNRGHAASVIAGG